MGARIRLWWEKIRKPPAVFGFIALLVVVIALIFVEVRLYGTGFAGKTLWDWLQLLIIPLVLAVAALLFNLATSLTEQKIALDKQRQDLLQAYLDRMSELLLDKQLRASKPDTEVRNVARVRTITVLTQLDARRIGYVFAFLREARLMSATSNDNVVSLKNADLHTINWSQADLSGANLREANLSRAALIKANLCCAKLYFANLYLAEVSEANLSGAALWSANLSGANLSGASLVRANLSDAGLTAADLSGANLSGASLVRANLKDATGIITDELEKQAKSLKGATMPDGSIHP